MQRYWDGRAWTDAKVAPARRSPGLSTKQKWWFLGLVIAGILVFSVIGVMSNNVTAENTGDGHTPGTGRQPTATQAGIGQPVREGEFEFVVSGVYNQRGYTTRQETVTNIGT